VLLEPSRSFTDLLKLSRLHLSTLPVSPHDAVSRSGDRPISSLSGACTEDRRERQRISHRPLRRPGERRRVRTSIGRQAESRARAGQTPHARTWRWSSFGRVPRMAVYRAGFGDRQPAHVRQGGQGDDSRNNCAGLTDTVSALSDSLTCRVVCAGPRSASPADRAPRSASTPPPDRIAAWSPMVSAMHTSSSHVVKGRAKCGEFSI